MYTRSRDDEFGSLVGERETPAPREETGSGDGGDEGGGGGDEGKGEEGGGGGDIGRRCDSSAEGGESRDRRGRRWLGNPGAQDGGVVDDVRRLLAPGLLALNLGVFLSKRALALFDQILEGFLLLPLRGLHFARRFEDLPKLLFQSVGLTIRILDLVILCLYRRLRVEHGLNQSSHFGGETREIGI